MQAEIEGAQIRTNTEIFSVSWEPAGVTRSVRRGSNLSLPKSAEWNRAKAHAVIVDFVRANPEMTYSEVAGVFGLHPVTVNRIVLRVGEKRGSGRRRGKLGRKGTAPMDKM